VKTEVKEKFDSYPEHIKPLILYLRELVFCIAEDLDAGKVEESLKWGEPSYQVKGGSPVRMDWKEKYPITIFFSSIAKRNSSIHFVNCIRTLWNLKVIALLW
jgi:hypothetical protein